MSKSKQKRKQAPSQGPNGTVAKKPKATDAPAKLALTGGSPYEPKLLNTVVSGEELEIAIDTLRALAANPSLIKSKGCKDLRAAVFDFKQASTTGALAAANANLTSRISGALADQRWVDARVLLAEMRVRGLKPKLGALCRWVRDLDVISGLAEQRAGTGVARTAAQREVLRVLDAVLRVVGPIDYSAAAGGAHDDGDDEQAQAQGPLAVRPAWYLRDGRRARHPVYARVLDGSLAAAARAAAARFRVLATTPGPARQPPNHHPAVLHASEDRAIALATPAPTPATRHTHPTVPNLHLLLDVLSPAECAAIVGAAEAVGFTPDAPLGGAGGERHSVLAHNFYWLADRAFAAALWARVAPWVPAAVGGRRVRGLNRRLRVYRYVPGAEYRAHIDGAWPPSGSSSSSSSTAAAGGARGGGGGGGEGGQEDQGQEDQYVYDASPAGARQSSLFTFLLYLNDDFAGGETTFFLPGAREGVLNAYPLKPIQGSVALFPHGEVEGTLLHEGTGVRSGEGGAPSAKYVVRTDVEYDVDVETS